MIPVLTANAARLNIGELAAIGVVEQAAALAPSAASAAAELAAVVPLWSLIAYQWRPEELAARDGLLMRRLIPWIAGGILPRARRVGESPEAYAAALDAASLRLTTFPQAAEVRAIGKLVRRFARLGGVMELLRQPDVARVGLVNSAGWPRLARLVRNAAAAEPRAESSSMTEAGEIDWEAENAKARSERKAQEASTRKEFYAKSAALGAAYASACAAFPALLVAAPAVAAAFALSAVMFEGFLTVGRWLGSGDANSSEEIARVAKELRYFTDRGIPALVFDGEIWNARGFADTLRKVSDWIETAPIDVKGAIYDLGQTIKKVGAVSSVANDAIGVITSGPAGFGPIWAAVVFKKDPGASTIATRMGTALASILASFYDEQGYFCPEAKMRAAAIDAYRATLLDPKVSIENTYGFALARAWDAAIATAKTGLVAAPKVSMVKRIYTTPTPGTAPAAAAPSTGGGAAAVLTLGALALLFL